MENRKFKILLFTVLLSLLLPFAQKRIGLFEENPLQGAITSLSQPTFSLATWREGEYQENAEAYLNESFGFRNTFIRLNNQLAFSLYNKARANGVIVGKDEYLYEENYIKSYYGEDFIGSDKMDSFLEKLHFVTQSLKKRGVSLVFVLEPGKASYYPEYIPDRYNKKRSITNKAYFKTASKKFDIPILDLHSYFIELKNRTEYPLFTKCGIHWSSYGELLAIDTLMKFLTIQTNKPLPTLQFMGGNIENATQQRDADIAVGVNLFSTIDCGLAWYPEYKVVEKDRVKISALSIADSFFWGIFQNNDISKLFQTTEFWYYYAEMYSTQWKSFKPTSELNLKAEIEKHQVVLIMVTDAKMDNPGYGFIEAAYTLYSSEDSLK
jgi:hypothetical protein